jgi:hypothetical protein
VIPAWRVFGLVEVWAVRFTAVFVASLRDMSSAGRSSRFLAAWYTRNNGGRAQRTLGWPAALIVFAGTFALAFTPSLCESCSSGVQSLQSNGMFSNAMNEYYQVRGCGWLW